MSLDLTTRRFWPFKKKEKRPSLGFWRDNIESLTVAILMALLIKQFVFEAYAVPTESMEPTIIGRTVGGDRIIANKFLYMMRDPKRWEVMIFQYPLNRSTNYVKRCVGLPDEWLFIRNGDIYTAEAALDHKAALAAATVERKPNDLQECLFDHGQCIPPGERTVKRFRRYWATEKGSATDIRINEDDEVVRMVASDHAVTVSFTRPDSQKKRFNGSESVDVPLINNRRYDDWSPMATECSSWQQMLGVKGPATGGGPMPGYDDAVGDVRLAFEVNPESSKGSVILEIMDGTHGMPIRLTLGVEGSDEKSVLLVGKKSVALEASIPTDDWTAVEFWNVDDRVRVLIDSDEVASVDYTHAPIEPAAVVMGGGKTSDPAYPSNTEMGEIPPVQPTHKLPHRNNVSFGFDGGSASFREIDLARDTYYTAAARAATDFAIPKRKYLMFGDNSPDSLDARGWKKTRLTYKGEDGKEMVWEGDAEGVSDSDGPGHVFGNPEHPEWATHSNTRPYVNPFTEDGKIWFIDNRGNRRELEKESIVKRETYFGHYVDRDHVMARAYFKFWPPLAIGVIR